MAVLFFILFSVSRYTSLMNGRHKKARRIPTSMDILRTLPLESVASFQSLLHVRMSFGVPPDMTGQEQCSLQLVSAFDRPRLHITSLSTFYLLGSADSLISFAKVRKNSETTKFLACFLMLFTCFFTFQIHL